jgi:hypothetical protein
MCMEIVRFVDIGVFECNYSSTWHSPSFAIPKKHGKQYNKSCYQFQEAQLLIETSPISYSKDWNGGMIRSVKGINFASALYLNMGYYHIKLDADTQKLCIMIFPWRWENINTSHYPRVSKLPVSWLFVKWHV